ncbi:unnamed protein product [Symbiodinium natans]|uniref:Uncharacterized protein n=1 Tax=Symbiodinium natans TaxID=878477 RepID=A0A812KTT1_9DINO|nr:unnamed protein product [Symbiodinium natans]
MSTITGTLTRPFTKNPPPLVPPSPERRQEKTPDPSVRGSRLLLVAGAEPGDRDAWWHKQAEIRELQAANKSLLRRVYDPSPNAVPRLPKKAEEASAQPQASKDAAEQAPAAIEAEGQQPMASIEPAAPIAPDEVADSPSTRNGAESVASTQIVRTRTESEATFAASTIAKLEGQLHAQEEALMAERARYREDMQWHQAEAAEERKRLRRDAAKKVAELQSRSTELVEEVQEATAKAKEAERTMHSRISSMRSASQRLRNQLQAERGTTSTETLEERDTQHRDQLQRLEELRFEVECREAASSELELALAFERSAAKEEREALLKELADLSTEASQARSRNAEIVKKDEELETQLANLSGQLKTSEAAAAVAMEQMKEEGRAACLLQSQCQEAESKAQTASEQYQALIQALKKEQEAADCQLQNLLQEAARKQNELHELGGEGAILNMPEACEPMLMGLACGISRARCGLDDPWCVVLSSVHSFIQGHPLGTLQAWPLRFCPGLTEMEPTESMEPWLETSEGARTGMTLVSSIDGIVTQNFGISKASARAQWLVENQGLDKEAAQQRIMKEFPSVFGAPRGWNPDEDCAGTRAEDRALWLMQNQGMNREDAQRKVMDEFPQLFLRASGVAGEDVPVLQSSSQPSQPSQPSKPSKPSGSGYLPSREVQGSPEANPPRWPSSVLVLSKGSGYDVVDQIYEEMSSLDRGQFSTSRYALLFEASPKMHDVDVRVGFYTSVYGLGRHPSDTNIRSVTSTNETPHPELGSLQNFWRSAENFQTNCHPTYTCGGKGGMLWAVSQAAPLRRVVVDDNLWLSYFRMPPDGVKASDPRYPKQGACLEYDGWVKLGYRDPVMDFASGGFMANVEVRGTASFGAQQQFFARNCTAKSWEPGAWNFVFVGCPDAPNSGHLEAADKGPISTNVSASQVIAEKPFIVKESDGRYKLVVPSASTGRIGTDFELAEEEIRDFSTVFVAQPSSGAAEINRKLAEGKDVVFAPGIYNLEETLRVQKSGQVLLALGFATLVAPTDSPCILVDDEAVGVRISGMMMEAAYRPLKGASPTELTSPGPKALLQWGCGKAARSDPAVPGTWGFLHDCFARVGGQEAPFTARDEVDPSRTPKTRPHSEKPLFDSEARCSAMVQIQAPCVVGDNLWLWRADHWLSDQYLVYNHENRCETGLHVGPSARYVTMYGLFVEHTLGDMTYWEGEDGTTFFYQSELPYDAMHA